MCKCIYTNVEEPASEAEHIFPKCIGGVRTLPVGWVSDSVNGAFSKMELGFARQYPPVVISRMFSTPMGRKKHKGRNRIGLMKGKDDDAGYMLGFIQNGIPKAIDQIVIPFGEKERNSKTIPIRIVIGPNEQVSKEQQIHMFWEKLKIYNGNPMCIKDLNVPEKTCLLGINDNRWFLGLSKSENPEEIKPRLNKVIAQIASAGIDTLLSAGCGPTEHKQQINAEFSFSFNYIDVLRVYAKIAVNCLAEVKGHQFAMNPALDNIKHAILTGEEITKYVTFARGPNPVPDTLRKFPDRVLIGERPHCTVFFQDKQGDLIAFVALFGTDNPVAVKLGAFRERVGVDLYLCDWEHQSDYTMEDFAVKVCNYNR